jgi:chemotaxis protein MotB
VSSRNKRPVVVKQGLDMWVMTYGDMMTLLLTFFVLIVSFSSIRESKFKQAAMALREAFGVLASPESVLALNQPIVPNHAPHEQSELLYEVRDMERSLLAEGLEGDVQAEITANGVNFRIAAPVLFETGTATLASQGREVLGTLARMIEKYPHEVRVEGHTDNVPIASARFPSNWHLSAGRAVAVATELQRQGIAPDRLSATGYGEFRPQADNGTAAGRAQNRRVEIFMEIPPPRQGDDRLPLQELEPAAPPVRLDRDLSSPVTERLGELGNE